MLNLQHPHILADWQSLKAIQRGGKQAADDAAMEAMWQALERGVSKDEANQIFSQTYINVLHGQQRVQTTNNRKVNT